MKLTFLSKTGDFLIKHTPEILVGLGIVGTVTTTVVACTETPKACDILKNHKLKINQIKQGEEAGKCKALLAPVKYSTEEAKKLYTKTNLSTAKELVVNYAPSISLGVLSLVCILAGFKILSHRYVTVCASYEALEKAYLAYRERVRKDQGEKKDIEYATGISSKKPNNKSALQKQSELDLGSLSPYARIFDEQTSPNFVKNSYEYNMAFLTQLEKECTKLLHKNGYLYLNEVYKLLGFPETWASRRVGWVSNPGNKKSDDYVSFGIWKIPKYVTEWGGKILLDFNVVNIDKDVFNDDLRDKFWKYDDLIDLNVKKLEAEADLELINHFFPD